MILELHSDYCPFITAHLRKVNCGVLRSSGLYFHVIDCSEDVHGFLMKLDVSYLGQDHITI